MARALQSRLRMGRLALVTLCLFATACLPIIEDDIDDDVDPGPPPPSLAVCGNGKLEGRETCDDGNRIGGDGCSASCIADETVRVRWHFATLAGEPRACPAGFDVAEVVARPDVWTAPVTKAFPCEAGEADVKLEQTYVPRDYDLQVRIKSSASGELYGLSAIDHLAGSDPRRESDLTIITDAGTITVRWATYLGAQPRFCPDAPEATVTVVARRADAAPIATTFPCSQSIGVTPLVPAGTYRVEVMGAWGTLAATTTLDAVEVPAGSRTATPPVVTLVF
jgi:cysteine-rich repeat protein